jgi:ABC-2 type transport system ATP-binding protein
MPIIETKSLLRRYGDLVAVNGVSISVEAGEVFGLLGPNGAGKSTIIKMLITLLPPTSGTAVIDGCDIRRAQSRVRRIIGYVPQLISADSTLTGYENLLIFAKLFDIPRSEREARIQDAISYMGLSDAADTLVRKYSGGMIRRLEIAQAMLHRPCILFLDEPTVGLDPSARKMVWEHIMGLRADYGTTIFLTTHLMEEADSLCARVAIMHKGNIAAIGTPEELKHSIGRENATLDEVFIHYAGDALTSTGGDYRATSRSRRNTKRLG